MKKVWKKYIRMICLAVLCISCISLLGCGTTAGSSETADSGKSSGNGNKITCTISIDCSTLLEQMDNLDPQKQEFVPSDGMILAATEVECTKGASVFDVLQMVCKDHQILMEHNYTPLYSSEYIEGINQLYEFDCGSLSGWMFRVNGEFPNYGCDKCILEDGDVIEWLYTCDLGKDVGADTSGE